MQLPLQITFRHMDPSATLEAKVRERAEKLERFADHIMSCRVVLEAPHKHRNQGNLYHVRLDITARGKEIVVSRESSLHQSHQDPYVAVRDAFDAARRQLEDYVRRRRGHVKEHQVPPHGRIVRLEPAANFGSILSADGREIYFHRNSVLNADFDKLEIGAEVRFEEEAGDQGPQATTVKVVGKHHVVG